MGSVFRKTSVREVPAGHKITKGRDGKITAKWTPRGASRSITAAVVTLDDGRQVVHVETGCFYAQYRDADGFTRTVSTRCKERANAEHFLADLERQVEHSPCRRHHRGRGPPGRGHEDRQHQHPHRRLHRNLDRQRDASGQHAAPTSNVSATT